MTTMLICKSIFIDTLYVVYSAECTKADYRTQCNIYLHKSNNAVVFCTVSLTIKSVLQGLYSPVACNRVISSRHKMRLWRVTALRVFVSTSRDAA